MSDESARPLPFTDDIDTGPYWREAAAGRLSLKACFDCGSWLHLPKAYCHHCRSWNTGWREVGGRGTLHTWTTVRQQLHPTFPVPHALVLVDIDDALGVRLLGRIDGDPQLHAGQCMCIRFDRSGDPADPTSVAMPNWDPAVDQPTL